MSLINRLNLRQNWPLVVATLTFLVVYVLFSWIHPQQTAAFYQPKIGEKVEYESLLAQHSIRARVYPALLVLGMAAIALITLFGISRISRRNAILTIMLVILTQCWTLKIMGDSSGQDGTVLKNVQSIQYKQVTYKLTLSSTLGSGADWIERDFLIYKCEVLDQICTLIKTSLDENYANLRGASEASLKIDPITNGLYLQIGTKKTLIGK